GSNAMSDRLVGVLGREAVTQPMVEAIKRGEFLLVFLFPRTTPAEPGPHFRPETFPEIQPPPPLGEPRDVAGNIRGGRMSDAFAFAHIARFIQAPAVFIRCILGNHFAHTGTVFS